MRATFANLPDRCPCSASWPDLFRPSTSFFQNQDVDARHKAGDDGGGVERSLGTAPNTAHAREGGHPEQQIAHLEIVALDPRLRGDERDGWLAS